MRIVGVLLNLLAWSADTMTPQFSRLWLSTGGGFCLAISYLGWSQSSLSARGALQRAFARSKNDGFSLGPEPATTSSKPDMKPVLR
jgi:hypothetical protein